MDIEKECKKALDLGVSIRFLANKINRDHTTLTKWLRGERNISIEIQNELAAALRELKEKWNEIEV